MNAQSPPLTENPGPIMGIMTGYWHARILLTAVNADVFTELAGSPATAAEVAGRLGQVMPGTRDFLLALTGLGLLELRDGRFANSPVADRFLVRDRPGSIGGYLRFCERELNPAWDGLASALRTGKPQNRAALEGNPYHTLYQDKEATDAFLDSMDLFNTPIALQVSSLDWSAYQSFVDVGGARGSLAHRVVSRHPHLAATVFDLPALEPAFHRYMATVDVPKPIAFRGGVLFPEPTPD